LALTLAATPVALAQAPDAKAELAAAINILQKYHLNRDKVDWPSLSDKAGSLILDPQNASGAYGPIRYVIAQLGITHTQLMTANQVKAINTGRPVGAARPPRVTPPQGYLLEGGIGLIEEKFLTGRNAEERQYEMAARHAIDRFNAKGICRFILDLRGNSGGNMYPMIAGVSALLGKGPYGYFNVDQQETAWVWPRNMGDIEDRVAAQPAWLTQAPVAVLLDGFTASSGEFTAMAFKGRRNTRFFGEDTAGLLSANRAFPLPDGASLIVSTGWGSDRNHVPYTTVISPDEATPRGQETLDAAIAWLMARKCPVRSSHREPVSGGMR
jgi:hypothetical protein